MKNKTSKDVLKTLIPVIAEELDAYGFVLKKNRFFEKQTVKDGRIVCREFDED